MSQDPAPKSLAEALMAKHELDITDQDKISPSHVNGNGGPTEKSSSVNGSSDNQPEISNNAEEDFHDSPKKEAINSKNTGSIDILSLDAFPSLGGSNNRSQQVSKGAWSNGGASTGISQQSVQKPSAISSGKPFAARPGVVTEVFTLPGNEQKPAARSLLNNVLSKIKKSTDTSIESSTSRVNGNTTFVVKGKLHNVQRAKRELIKELSPRVIEKLQIPASVRALIIGHKGATLKPIIDKSGAQIQVSKDVESSLDLSEFDDDKVVQVIIEGDSEGVKIAKAEILAIVSSRVKDATVRLNNIDSKFYQFLAADSDIKNLEKSLGVSIKVPTGTDQEKGQITISGERTAVIEAKTRVEALALSMSTSYVTTSLDISRAKRKLLSNAEIFDLTGVAVVENTDESDNSISLIGPAKNLDSAIKLIATKSKNFVVSDLDISKAHGKSIVHAQNLARYFERSGKLNDLEKMFNVAITSPPFSDITGSDVREIKYEIAGISIDDVKSARKSLVETVNEYPPIKVKAIDDIDTFFYPFLKGADSRIVESLKNVSQSVSLQLPTTIQDRIILLVYETSKEPEEDFAPSSEEIADILNKSNVVFDEIREKQNDLESKTLNVASEFQKHIVGPRGSTLKKILNGNSGQREKSSFVSVEFGKDNNNLDENTILIRGLKSEVDIIVKELEDIVEEAKNYEVLSSYTTNFTFPTNLLKKLIGKGGNTLTKIREEFGVKIDLGEDGEGVIKGIRKQAEEAKSRILNLGRRWADEVTLKLTVPAEHRATIIGQGGKYVKRLEDKYDVFIKFSPPTNNSNDDDSSNDASKDEVTVRGPSKGAEKAKEELLDLLKYEIDHSYSDSIVVPAKALPRIIGRGGEYINDIKDSTNTKIDIANAEDRDDSKGVPISIVGTKTGVKTAINKIQEIVKELDNFITEELDVNPKLHRLLIGSNGSTMNEILAKAGQVDGSASRMIQIPPADSGDSIIRIQGNKEVVARVVQIIRDIVDSKLNEVETIISVPVEKHGALIGSGGSVKKDLESTYNISLFIPKQGSVDSNGNFETAVKIVGKQENVEKAKAKIVQMTAEAFRSELAVQANLHSQLSDRGGLARKLKSDFNVRVDYGKPSSVEDAANDIPPTAVGTIDEEESKSKAYKWTIVLDSQEKTDNEINGKDIIWKFKGKAEDCEKAKAFTISKLEEIKSFNATGYLWLADPSQYRLIVGPQGSTINSIRRKSGCIINVPKNDAKPESKAIVFRGQAERLEKAKDLALNSLSKSGN